MPRKRVRQRLRYVPQWDGVLRRYAKSFIYQNLWRVDTKLNDPEDLLQDAYLIFMHLCDKYPRVVEEKNFMALFKVSLRNRFHDKALYMKRKREIHQDTSQDVSDELYAGRIGEQANWGYAAALVREAPEEIRLALRLLVQNPEALNELPDDVGREAMNDKIRRVLTARLATFDFVTEIKELLA